MTSQELAILRNKIAWMTIKIVPMGCKIANIQMAEILKQQDKWARIIVGK